MSLLFLTLCTSLPKKNGISTIFTAGMRNFIKQGIMQLYPTYGKMGINNKYEQARCTKTLPFLSALL